MLLIEGKGIRGAIYHAINRYAKANNKNMKDYNQNKEVLGCKYSIQIGNVRKVALC